MSYYRFIKKNYPSILQLGWISFFTDVASEMLYPLTPIFLTTVLGTSMSSLGFIEGIAEGLASLLKTFFGLWSDKIVQRKPFIFWGYFLSTISRPLIGLSVTPLEVLLARGMDRVGKGIRTAPRDALMADLVMPQDRGLAFGWHRLMDTMGAVLGPLGAIIFLHYWSNLRWIYIVSIIPGIITIFLILKIKETAKIVTPKKVAGFGNFSIAEFCNEYKLFIFSWGIFCLTNSSDVFLILNMKTSGLSLPMILLIYSFFNFIYALFSPLLGRYADLWGKRKMIILGTMMFCAVYTGFAFVHQVYLFTILFGGYGLYMAATEGVHKAYISEMVPTHLKGSALGVLGSVTGIAQIGASIMAGFIWDHYGVQWAMFYSVLGGGVFLTLMIFFNPQKMTIKPSTINGSF